MSDPAEQKSTNGAVRLVEAIREAKNAAADREDVVVDLREAQKTRLELLAAELAPIFAEVPAEIGFDFAISSGMQPRLWIDAVSHVSMGRDRRTYRFLRDTRLGRVVLAESLDIGPVADQVTRYIAERIVERQRMMEGDVETALEEQPTKALERITERPTRWRSFLSGVLLVLAGAMVGLVVTAALLWDRLAAIGSHF
ncbi:hypothetical protein SAZ10_15295 [Mesorhizobium sp. BAC0120]|uniref:hypothetical protein n=1 Tax=Mesorhizobium sp. BAC0120 TaxID=3090670 RepID=UPI00298BCCB9|nr:hypothetical protein [Mesorhizobium sp. BAC0120]MDW6023125.1 hypothetical protein [Mesorhizobium sp. BAC0120]